MFPLSDKQPSYKELRAGVRSLRLGGFLGVCGFGGCFRTLEAVARKGLGILARDFSLARFVPLCPCDGSLVRMPHTSLARDLGT